MYIPTDISPLSATQLSKLLKGHSVRVKHGQGMKVHLSQQQHKKLLSSHMKGKGMNLMFDPYQVDSHSMNGSGFLSSAMSAGKKLATSKVGKSLINQGIKAGAKVAGNYVPPSIANAIAEEAVDRVKGMGFMSNAMSAGKKLAKTKLAKDLMKQGVKAGAKYASNYIPSSVANAIAEEAIDQVEGQGLFGDAMKGLKKVATSKIGKEIAKQGIKYGATALGKTGYVPPSVANLAANAATKAIGSGVRRRKGKKTRGGALYPAGRGFDVYED